LLKTNGVVRSALAFEIYAGGIQTYAASGRVLLRSCHDRPRSLLEARQRPGLRAAFTVREGETMFDIARELEAAKFMRAGDFLFAAGDPATFAILLLARRRSKVPLPGHLRTSRHPAPAN